MAAGNQGIGDSHDESSSTQTALYNSQPGVHPLRVHSDINNRTTLPPLPFAVLFGSKLFENENSDAKLNAVDDEIFSQKRKDLAESEE